MDKIKLSILVRTLVLALSQENAFAALPYGLYVDAGIGGQNSNFKHSASQTINIPTVTSFAANENLTQYSNNFIAGLGIGYSQKLAPQFVMAIEGTANWDNTDVSTTVTANNGTVGLNNKIETKLKNDFAILLKPGLLLDRNTLVYGMIGPRWGNVETIYNANFTTTTAVFNPIFRNSTYKLGVTAGLGIQRDIDCHLSLAAEYAYTYYGNLPVPGNASLPILVAGTQVGTATNNSEARGFTNSLMLKLIYQII